MNRKCAIGLLLAGLACASAGSAAETIKDALGDSKPIIDWRIRYEGVDQAGIAESAEALTSRLRAGFQTGAWHATTLLGEAVWTDDLIDDFNSTTNGRTSYPVVADPGGFAAINRFALTNKSLEHTALTFGRQRIVLDDSRFVGNVGWRQNEQTYDGLRAQMDWSAVDLDLSYVSQVNRIFGPDSPVGKWSGDIVLANLSASLPIGKLTAFAYSLDLDEAAGLSSDTLGLRLSGSKALDKLSLLYTASLARQTDAGRNPADYAENYFLLEGGLRAGKFTTALGYELLGSDGVNAVSMPLATLHAFQGWADKFLATPAGGIADSYVRLVYQSGAHGPFENLNVVGVYHDFESDQGSVHYGSETDLSLVARFRRMTATLKYAAYDADSLFTDTDKLWLSLDYAF